jgi:hypothetical protein
LVIGLSSAPCVARRLRRVDAAGDEDQRHPVLLGVGHHVDRIGDAGAQGGQQDARRAGHVIGALGHEAGGVFVLGEVKGDAGLGQGVHHGQDLAAGNAEGIAAAGLVQPAGDNLGGTGHGAQSCLRARLR